MLAAVATLASLAIPAAPGAAGSTEEWGYISTSDGARLRYTVVKPAASGRFPVALIYSPYADGVGPTDDYPIGEDAVVARELLAAGYAVVGVNARGTGCSSGQWDLFQPASDGYEVVEWAAAQPWSSGDVGMFGFSAPAISQLVTAATKPPHLRAISPSDVTTDLYRDVAYPGGILNTAFVGLWSLAYRPGISELSAIATAQGDTECSLNMAAREADGDLQPNNGWEALTALQHPSDDEVWARYSPQSTLAQVRLPVLACQAGQDEQVGSRAGSYYFDALDKNRTWTVFTNGAHGTCDDFAGSPFTDLLVRFFDRYVKGSQNGFENEPHVRIWHETAGSLYDWIRPAWVTTHTSWPPPVKAKTYYLRGGGRLDGRAPSLPEAPDRYTYPLLSSSTDDTEFAQPHLAWKVPNAPGGSVSFTTPALSKDLEVFGPGSVDLWVSSSASDTDLQVTLTEVRSDGQEVYLQRGWLRASHRKLDAGRSTPLRPFHTHKASDAAALVPGQPTLARVELNPLSHVFRKGSAIRVYVEAPTGLTGERGFQFLVTPAVNSVLHDPAHPSKLVLGSLAGGAPTGPPPCDTVLSQPCRTNLLALPLPLLDTLL
ncbi:MAG: CocE/NonD family hydrolase [Actinobacteria bacterium]|nr:CocE/NonD family hydrolase [Actinomycetota bacterium]